jgi:hypothetical protein
MMAASSGMHSYYNKVSTTDGAVHITPGTVQDGSQGIVAGQAAADTSMNATYVEYMGQRFMIPVGAQIMYTSNNMFAGYKEIGGETVTVETLMASSSTGMHSYYDKKVTTVGKVAGTTGVIAGKIGQNAGAKAAEVSMKATYYKYMGHKFTIPAGAQVMWSAG